jgi:hypothetical protein
MGQMIARKTQKLKQQGGVKFDLGFVVRGGIITASVTGTISGCRPNADTLDYQQERKARG